MKDNANTVLSLEELIHYLLSKSFKNALRRAKNYIKEIDQSAVTEDQVVVQALYAYRRGNAEAMLEFICHDLFPGAKAEQFVDLYQDLCQRIVDKKYYTIIGRTKTMLNFARGYKVEEAKPKVRNTRCSGRPVYRGESSDDESGLEMQSDEEDADYSGSEKRKEDKLVKNKKNTRRTTMARRCKQEPREDNAESVQRTRKTARVLVKEEAPEKEPVIDQGMSVKRTRSTARRHVKEEAPVEEVPQEQPVIDQQMSVPRTRRTARRLVKHEVREEQPERSQEMSVRITRSYARRLVKEEATNEQPEIVQAMSDPVTKSSRLVKQEAPEEVPERFQEMSVQRTRSTACRLVKEEVTEEVTEAVTEGVTEEVTEEVIEEVTEDGTEDGTEEDSEIDKTMTVPVTISSAHVLVKEDAPEEEPEIDQTMNVPATESSTQIFVKEEAPEEEPVINQEMLFENEDSGNSRSEESNDGASNKKIVTREIMATEQEGGQESAKRATQVKMEEEEEENMPTRPVQKRKQDSTDDGPSRKRTTSSEVDQTGIEIKQENENDPESVDYNGSETDGRSNWTVLQSRNYKTYVLIMLIFDDRRYEKFMGRAEHFLATIPSPTLTKRQLLLKALLAFRQGDLPTLEDVLKNNSFPTSYIGFLKNLYLNLYTPCLLQLPFIIARDDSETVFGIDALREAIILRLFGWESNFVGLMQAANVTAATLESFMRDEAEAVGQWNQEKLIKWLDNSGVYEDDERAEYVVPMEELPQETQQHDPEVLRDEIVEAPVVVEEEALRESEEPHLEFAERSDITVYDWNQEEEEEEYEPTSAVLELAAHLDRLAAETQARNNAVEEERVVVEEGFGENEAQNQEVVPIENSDAQQDQDQQLVPPPVLEEPVEEAPVADGGVAENMVPNVEVEQQQQVRFIDYTVAQVADWVFDVTECSQSKNVIIAENIDGKLMKTILNTWEYGGRRYLTTRLFGRLKVAARKIFDNERAQRRRR